MVLVHLKAKKITYPVFGVCLMVLNVNNFHYFSDWGSAMMIILAGTKEEHLNMLEGGIIAKLLEEKWGTFAQV